MLMLVKKLNEKSPHLIAFYLAVITWLSFQVASIGALNIHVNLTEYHNSRISLLLMNSSIAVRLRQMLPYYNTFGGVGGGIGSIPNFPISSSPRCSDLFHVCPQYRSLCSSSATTQLNSIPINQACPFTCNTCNSIPPSSLGYGCVDRDPVFCPKLIGFCRLTDANINGLAIGQFCSATCGTCQNSCDDVRPDCSQYTTYCGKPFPMPFNGRLVNSQCPRSCGVCPNNQNYNYFFNNCNDVDPVICAQYAGQCQSGAYIGNWPIKQFCPRTCSCCIVNQQVTIFIPIPSFISGFPSTLTCADQSITCPDYAAYCTLSGAKINNIPLAIFCAKTCNTTCTNTCYDQLPSLCASLATECSKGRVFVNGYPLTTFCKATCNTC